MFVILAKSQSEHDRPIGRPLPVIISLVVRLFIKNKDPFLALNTNNNEENDDQIKIYFRLFQCL